jgi:hypothetical protein
MSRLRNVLRNRHNEDEVQPVEKTESKVMPFVEKEEIKSEIPEGYMLIEESEYDDLHNILDKYNEDQKKLYDLYKVLDDIDTTSDIYKEHTNARIEHIEDLHKKRHDILNDDEVDKLYGIYYKIDDDMLSPIFLPEENTTNVPDDNFGVDKPNLGLVDYNVDGESDTLNEETTEDTQIIEDNELDEEVEINELTGEPKNLDETPEKDSEEEPEDINSTEDNKRRRPSREISDEE